MFKLVIADKNLSSWSLRPWLVLKQLDEPFLEHPIPLRQPDTRERILAISPAGKVPVLLDRQLRVWDSLAICEYLAECFPGAHLWPQDPALRAEARSVSAEMHAGFTALRTHLPMDICGRHDTPELTAEVHADIQRISTLWEDLRQRHHGEGPFLFGHFTIADAMYAPVVTRFKSYGVALQGMAAAYAEHMLALPAMRQWYADAAAEVAAASV